MKDKAFIIDFNLLNEQNLSIDEFLTLLYLKEGIIYIKSKELLLGLEEKQFIKINKNSNNSIEIREKGKLFVDFVSIESINSISNKKIVKKSQRAINEGLIEFIKQYRSLWKGLKPGSMGSENGCRDKLIRWMNENPTYSKDDIIKAVKLYLNSVENYQYLQQADYFIYKKDAFGESSRLSSFIDEIGNDLPEENWTTNLI